jgi:superfamily II DNA/RNA helicase
MRKGGVIIFVNTRARASFLVKHLVASSIAATCIHGELVAEERRDNLQSFSKGQCEVLVATGAFGRGLDLPVVTHVINFDLPHTRDEYVKMLLPH